MKPGCWRSISSPGWLNISSHSLSSLFILLYSFLSCQLCPEDWKLRLLIIMCWAAIAFFIRLTMFSCGSLFVKVKELISSQDMVEKVLIFLKMSSGRCWHPELMMYSSFYLRKMLRKEVQYALFLSWRWLLFSMEIDYNTDRIEEYHR